MLIKAESLQKIPAWPSPAPSPWLACPPGAPLPSAYPTMSINPVFRALRGWQGRHGPQSHRNGNNGKPLGKRRGDLMFQCKVTFFPRHSFSSPGGKAGSSLSSVRPLPQCSSLSPPAQITPQGKEARLPGCLWPPHRP